MAFVYRKQKQDINNAQTPGPGQYSLNNSTIPATNSAIGFSNKVPRKLWDQIQNKKLCTPGPGEYNADKNAQQRQLNGFQTIFTNSQAGFYVIDSFYNRNNQGTASFKSKSNRLGQSRCQSPGPGQYQTQDLNSRDKDKIGPAWQKPSKLTRYLYEQNIKQVKGLVDMQPDQYSTKNLTKGIHHKNQQEQKQNIQKISKKQQIKNNYNSIFHSKVQRKYMSRPQTSNGVGPGSYNIAQAFRSIQRKSFNNKQKNVNIQTAKNNNTQDKYIGPGYYQIQTSSFKRPQTSQSKGIPCFGSKQSRFGSNNIKNNKQNIPGPHSYFKNQNKALKQTFQSQQQKRKIGFNSCVSKQNKTFTTKPSTVFTQISPCSYNPKNDFNHLLKKNYIKGTIGQFGSTVKRFQQSNHKNQDESTKIQPSIFENQKLNANKNKKQKNNFSNFRKINQSFNNKHNIQKQKVISFDQRPLCYNPDAKTIKQKNCIKTQLQAPFLVASERFAGTKSNFQQQFYNYIKSQQQKSILIKGKNRSAQLNKSNKIHKGSQISVLKKYNQTAKEVRAIQGFLQFPTQKIQVQVGPQTYNPCKNVKKSYNILFQH